MPRTKPQEIKPESKARGRLGRGRRRRRGQGRAAARSSSSCATPSASRSSARRCRKGILLHGPPGTGKTLLAKAVAHESGRALLLASRRAAFVEMFAGLGAARIRRLFSEAREHRPAIIFIDEIDAVGARARLGQQLRARADAQPAAGRDGRLRLERGDLVVIAASNLLEKLDPALLRPGRFDRQVFVSPPDVDGPRARS